MKRIFKKGLFISGIGLITIFLSSFNLHSTGLTTPFGEVTLENLAPGVSYNTREVVNLPYKILNNGKEEIEVQIDLVIPLDTDFRVYEKDKDYEPIPDLSWVKISQDHFILAPGETALTDIILTIPDKKEFYGRRFLVIVYPHILKRQFCVGLKSRLLFTTIEKPLSAEETRQLKQLKNVANLSFDVVPANLYLDDVPLGRILDVKKERKQVLKLVNSSDESLDLTVECISVEESLTALPTGFLEPPSRDILILPRKRLKVKANSIQELPFLLNFPTDKELGGQKYFFLVKVRPKRNLVKIAYYAKIYVLTQSEKKDNPTK